MICASCLAKKLVGSFERCVVKKSPEDYVFLNDTFTELSRYTDGDVCTECGQTIAENEVCYDEELMVNETAKNVGKMLTQKICCCEQCGAGTVIDDYGWALRKSCIDDEEREEAEKELSRLTTSEPLEDLFWDYFEDDCWIDQLSIIASNTYCPNCLNGYGIDYDDKIDYGELNQYTEVYTKSDLDDFNKKFYGEEEDESPERLLEDIVNSFEYEEIRKMVEDYISGEKVLPTLSKLEKYINKLFEEKFFYVLSEGRLVYRARPNEKLELFQTTDMWEPPNDKATQGRYNEEGASVLYCANCIDALRLEVKDKGSGYTVGKFEINKDMLLMPINRIFSGEYAEYVISEDLTDTPKGKKSYLLTNLISLMCKKAGYDGVAYTSVKCDQYVNYALFCKYTRGKEISCIGVIGIM